MPWQVTLLLSFTVKPKTALLGYPRPCAQGLRYHCENKGRLAHNKGSYPPNRVATFLHGSASNQRCLKERVVLVTLPLHIYIYTFTLYRVVYIKRAPPS